MGRSERGLLVLAVAISLAAHAGAPVLSIFAEGSADSRPQAPPRPFAVWGYMPPPPPPPRPEEPAPAARPPERAAARIAPRAVPVPTGSEPTGDTIPAVTTEPVVEPTGEITPSPPPREVEMLFGTAEPLPQTAIPAPSPEGFNFPRLLRESRREPRYPEAVRRFRRGASVLLRVLVRADGTVGDIAVLRSTWPKVGFEEAALEAVRHWRYVAASLDGDPISATVTVKVDFKP